MATFLSCLYYCKTEGCLGLIVPQYDARRRQDAETGKWKLTCPECKQQHLYDESEARTDNVPAERLRELYPERYPN
jgi:RNase P subunit RPR2